MFLSHGVVTKNNRRRRYPSCFPGITCDNVVYIFVCVCTSVYVCVSVSVSLCLCLCRCEIFLKDISSFDRNLLVVIKKSRFRGLTEFPGCYKNSILF